MESCGSALDIRKTDKLLPPAFANCRCLRLFLNHDYSPPLVKPDVWISCIRLADEGMPSPAAGISSLTPDVPDHTHDVICRLGNVRISQSSPCVSDHVTFASVQQLPRKVSAAMAPHLVRQHPNPERRKSPRQKFDHIFQD